MEEYGVQREDGLWLVLKNEVFNRTCFKTITRGFLVYVFCVSREHKLKTNIFYRWYFCSMDMQGFGSFMGHNDDWLGTCVGNCLKPCYDRPHKLKTNLYLYLSWFCGVFELHAMSFY